MIFWIMIDIYRSDFGDIEITVRLGKLVRLGFRRSGSDEADDSAPSYTDVFVLNTVFNWLDNYFAGKFTGFNPALLYTSGTEYQKRVWWLLSEIAPGTTHSYGQVSKRYAQTFGPRTSPRAVGSAVRANPVALIIPCHRVIGSDGSLVGYEYGVELKKRLLEHEARFLR